MPLRRGQPVELLGIQRINGIPPGVECQAVLECQFLHLLQGITTIEVAADIEIGTGNTGVVEILPVRTLGQHLEDIVDCGIPDQVFTIALLDLPEIITRSTGSSILSTRRWRRGWQFGKITPRGKGRSSDGHSLTGRIGWWWRRIRHTWCRRIKLGRAYQRR